MNERKQTDQCFIELSKEQNEFSSSIKRINENENPILVISGDTGTVGNSGKELNKSRLLILMDAINSNSNIKVLKFSYCSYWESTVFSFIDADFDSRSEDGLIGKNLQKNNSITHLYIEHSSMFSDKSYAEIAKLTLRKESPLVSLRTTYCNDSAKLFKGLMGTKSLRVLGIANLRLTLENADALCGFLKSNSSLIELRLPGLKTESPSLINFDDRMRRLAYGIRVNTSLRLINFSDWRFSSTGYFDPYSKKEIPINDYMKYLLQKGVALSYITSINISGNSIIQGLARDIENQNKQKIIEEVFLAFAMGTRSKDSPVKELTQNAIADPQMFGLIFEMLGGEKNKSSETKLSSADSALFTQERKLLVSKVESKRAEKKPGTI